MKHALFISSATIVLTISVPVAAQVKPQLTVDGVICELAGTCNSAAPEGSVRRGDQGRLVGNERAFTFVLANNNPANDGTADQNDTAGFSGGGGSAVQNAPSRPDAAAIRNEIRRDASVGQAIPPRSTDMLVTFRMGSADMTEQALENARIVARALQSRQLGNAQFLVEGHTDASGSRAYNLALSKRRALAVMQFLVDEGVSPDRLRAAGFGFDRLRTPSRPTDASNRRVQIVKID